MAKSKDMDLMESGAKVKIGTSDMIIRGFGYVFVTFYAVCCIVPFLIIIGTSFTSEATIRELGVQLIPKDFSLEAYKTVTKSGGIWKSYLLTIAMTVVGTGIGLSVIYEDDPDAESGFFYFGEESKNVTALSITHGAMAISAGSANPERALMVYDLLRNDPECYKLFCYGIEGVSYEITDDGLRTTPEGYNQDTDNINGTTNYWWGRNDDLEIRDANRDWDKIDELYAEYDGIKIEYPYGQFVAEVDAIQSQIQNVNEVHERYMKQIAFGKYSGTAEEIVAEYQAALEGAGINDVTAELQRQFDELYK